MRQEHREVYIVTRILESIIVQHISSSILARYTLFIIINFSNACKIKFPTPFYSALAAVQTRRVSDCVHNGLYTRMTIVLA